MDAFYDYDITQTWSLKKKVLLIGADTNRLMPDATGAIPSLDDIMAIIK